DELDAGELSGRRLRDLRGQFALVDSFGLRAERTVAGNVALPLERLGLDGGARRARVAELLDLVGLTRAAISSPGELNEGQRSRPCCCSAGRRWAWAASRQAACSPRSTGRVPSWASPWCWPPGRPTWCARCATASRCSPTGGCSRRARCCRC